MKLYWTCRVAQLVIMFVMGDAFAHHNIGGVVWWASVQIIAVLGEPLVVRRLR